jgi:putative hemolysin
MSRKHSKDMQQTQVQQPVSSSSKVFSQPSRLRVRTSHVQSFEIISGKYSVRFARTLHEISNALDVQHRVFDLELKNSFDAPVFEKSYSSDSMPSNYLFLIVVDTSTEQVVGTYRISTIETVGSVEEFSSAHVFDLFQLPGSIISQSIEISRLCILSEHRNKQVLFLLWKGLANHLMNTEKRYLFGCCSIFSQDFMAARLAYESLRKGGHFHNSITVSPTKACRFTALEMENATRQADVELPKLFGSYLKTGAKICSEPAIDREFKTVDFFMLFDINAMSEKYFRMFFA